VCDKWGDEGWSNTIKVILSTGKKFGHLCHSMRDAQELTVPLSTISDKSAMLSTIRE
jgi:hypothetical protein